MKKINLGPALLILLTSVTLFTSCSSEQVNVIKEKQINLDNYLEFGKAISNDLKSMSDELRENKISLKNEIETKKQLNIYSQSSNKIGDFYSINAIQESELKELLNQMINKQTPEDAINFLDFKLIEIESNTTLTYDEKDFLLLNTVVIKEFISFINENQDLFNTNLILTNRLGSWWDCMKATAGKTIGRGIAGGFIVGFVTGGLVGATGGTAVVPIVGTVVGGVSVAVVGGAVGAVRGAVLGAFWASADCM